MTRTPFVVYGIACKWALSSLYLRKDLATGYICSFAMQSLSAATREIAQLKACIKQLQDKITSYHANQGLPWEFIVERHMEVVRERDEIIALLKARIVELEAELAGEIPMIEVIDDDLDALNAANLEIEQLKNGVHKLRIQIVHLFDETGLSFDLLSTQNKAVIDARDVEIATLKDRLCELKAQLACPIPDLWQDA